MFLYIMQPIGRRELCDKVRPADRSKRATHFAYLHRVSQREKAGAGSVGVVGEIDAAAEIVLLRSLFVSILSDPKGGSSKRASGKSPIGL